MRIGVTPGQKRLLVQINEPQSVTAHGIIIPPNVNRDAATTGTVVAVPPAWKDENDTLYESEYEVGQQIVFSKHTGQEISIPVDSDPACRATVRLMVLWEKDVVATVRPVPDEFEQDSSTFVTEGAAAAIDLSARRL